MLKVVTKADYWSVLDEQGPIESNGRFPLLHRVRRKIDQLVAMPWHLKSIQDDMARSCLQDSKSLRIGEIGGGNSRLLPELSRDNDCYNIDEFRGEGNGPTEPRKLHGVTNVFAKIGASSDVLPDEHFDVLFSISVIEHVPQLDGFFTDCARLLKPGGRMIHLIDIYLEDTPEGNHNALGRIQAYRRVLDGTRFKPGDPDQVMRDEDVAFSTAFATNPDNVMRSWNTLAPELKAKREVAQSCTLLMIATRV